MNLYSNFLFLTLLSYLVEHCVAQQSDPSELLIWSCSSNGVNTYYYDPAVIRYYAQTATEIIIRSNLDPKAWVKSTPNSYALDSLRLGKSLSYTALGENVNTGMNGWTGPMSANMWNSCGQTDSFVTTPYWSCNNEKGLHLTSNWCGWSTDVGTPGGISVFIKRQLDTLVPIWRCYRDGANVALITTTAGLTAIGQQSAGITIYSTARPDEFVQTTSPSSYAIQSLKNAITLSYTPNGGFVDVSDWVGSSSLVPSQVLWNSCGSNQGFLTTPYWACNNQDGLHLTSQTCGWNSLGGTEGGITVAVNTTTPAPYRLVRIWYCSAPGQNTAVYDLNTIKQLAQYANGITIMSRNNPEEYITTASSNSYALNSLRAGQTLSFTSTGGYAITDDWVGTKTQQVPSSCGSPTDFTTTPYWACNTENGLHLTALSCGWSSDPAQATPGGIGVYLHFPAGFSASIQGTSLSFLESEMAFANPTIVNSGANGGASKQNIIIAGFAGLAGFVVVGIVIAVSVKVVKKKQLSSDYLLFSGL